MARRWVTAFPTATGETTPTRTLNINLFERLCAAQGAETERSRAKLLMVDRATLRRWRMRSHTPSMPVATWIAARLGVGLDELFPINGESEATPHHG